MRLVLTSRKQVYSEALFMNSSSLPQNNLLFLMFRVSYLQLQDTSITSKVHAVIHHVPKFIQRHNSSLGIYSEQATETPHHLFSNNWQKHKRPSNHPEYEDSLQRCTSGIHSKKFDQEYIQITLRFSQEITIRIETLLYTN